MLAENNLKTYFNEIFAESLVRDDYKCFTLSL